MRLVFIGTPQFSADFLSALINEPAFTVVGVVTQPDEPVGRKHILTPPPTKNVAQAHDIPVLQPTKLKDEAFQHALREWSADAFVVVAYGRIIPQAVLDIPRLGCINVHPSTLPKFRGPSPIQSAIAAGEHEIGISIMKLDAEMDHGPILAQTSFAIDTSFTNEKAFATTVTIGAPLLIQTLKDYAAGTITPQEQDHAAATFCTMLTREHGKIDWNEPAEVIERKIRAYTPWPGTSTTWVRHNQPVQLKIFAARVTDHQLTPGTVHVTGNQLLVGTRTTALEILELQPAGGKRMTSDAFLQGYRDISDIKLS